MRTMHKHFHFLALASLAAAIGCGSELPVDVAPKEKRRRERLTQPLDPSQGVSREEFDDMVRDLGIEEQPQPAAARSSGRPVGGRRARSRTNGGQDPKPPAQGGDGADSGDDKPKKPRNRRHGRPR